MSATISTDKFALYLGRSLRSDLDISASHTIPLGADGVNATRGAGVNRDFSTGIGGIKFRAGGEQDEGRVGSGDGDRGEDIGVFKAPVVHIPGYTFPVTEFYKGDFESIVRQETEKSLRKKGKQSM